MARNARTQKAPEQGEHLLYRFLATPARVPVLLSGSERSARVLPRLPEREGHAANCSRTTQL
jgi:hypothetical protein